MKLFAALVEISNAFPYSSKAVIALGTSSATFKIIVSNSSCSETVSSVCPLSSSYLSNNGLKLLSKLSTASL